MYIDFSSLPIVMYVGIDQRSTLDILRMSNNIMLIATKLSNIFRPIIPFHYIMLTCTKAYII